MYDPAEVERVCKECQQETDIVYQRDGGFFTPKLRGINFLQLGYSRMATNPITLLLESAYRLFFIVRDKLDEISKRLFPKPPEIVGWHKDTSVVGTLTFGQKNTADTDGDLTVPIHNMECQLWARTWWFSWHKLGETLSNYDGTFSIKFDLRESRRWRYRKLYFQVLQRTHYCYAGDQAQPILSVFKQITIPKSDVIGMQYSLQTIQLFYWEYREDTNVPRVVIKDHDKDAPEYYARGRQEAFIEQVTPVELIKIKHLQQLEWAPDSITMESLQQDYPENLTRCIERKLPGYSRSDEWMGKRMMNGMNRAYFEPDAQEKDAYWVKYYGICRYQHNDKYALPTAEMKFKLRHDGLPMPSELKLTGALNSKNNDPWQEHRFTNNDGDDWEHAKRVFRVNGSFTTELDEHFTGTHLNTEQYAIAAFRNLRLNPIAQILLPHLKEVSLINHSADNLLLSEFIPNVTALTPDGIRHRLRDVLGMQDWANWQPAAPLNDKHTSARAENLFWETVYQFVSEFVDEHEQEITLHWYEILCFSNDLVNHSVPVFLSDIDLKDLSEKDRQLAEQRFSYYAKQYGFDPSAERQTVNDEIKAVSAITLESQLSNKNKQAELSKLKHASAYMIMVATYLHTWINEHQYEQLGEVLYSCGGLRFGDQERGVIAPESDLSIAPSLARATQGLWFANILSRTEYGFITSNNENDVNPQFIKMLLAKEAEFKALDVDIHFIESRTNI